MLVIPRAKLYLLVGDRQGGSPSTGIEMRERDFAP